MAKDPDPNLTLTTITGVSKSIDDWTTQFHLALVVLPGRPDAATYLGVAKRLIDVFSGADCRAGYVVVGNERVAGRVLGSQSEERLAFCDPDAAFVKSLGLAHLPALVHIDIGARLTGVAEGWDPQEWARIATGLAAAMRWTKPVFPLPGDPPPFTGWAA